MEIEIKKKSPYQCEYTIRRKDGSVEVISLDAKTYLLHDLCHYAVEKALPYPEGFWGLLAKGFSFESLFGKDNPNTKNLRFIEQLVGPVQSVFLGNIPQKDFGMFIAHLDFPFPENLLKESLAEIKTQLENWDSLQAGAHFRLHWPL